MRFLRRFARRAFRIPAGLGATLALSALWFAGLPVTRAPPRRRAWRRFVFGAWARSLLRICAVRVRVIGGRPADAAFVVSNHTSYVDVLALASADSFVFVSMAELVRWPIVGAMARQFGTIFVERERKRDLPRVNRDIERAVSGGDPVVLFAEGRSSRGAGVLPFKPSLLEPAARSGHAVGWCAIRYETLAHDPPPSISVCWSDMSIVEQAWRFLALERVDATITFGPDVVRLDDRKVLARELEARVRAAFLPLRQS